MDVQFTLWEGAAMNLWFRASKPPRLCYDTVAYQVLVDIRGARILGLLPCSSLLNQIHSWGIRPPPHDEVPPGIWHLRVTLTPELLAHSCIVHLLHPAH